MASRLNLLFQTAPKQFLEKTVLFSNELTSEESLALSRDRMAHNIDIQPIQERSTARLLAGLHHYADTPLVSYFVPPNKSILIPREDPPQRFVFLPEFTGCRLLVSKEGPAWLKLRCERGLKGVLPPAESVPGSSYVDSFGYWDHTKGDLVGVIRATAVLVKNQDQPWTIFMQQIVGTAGFEVVRAIFSRTLRY